jgi:hypothetical protein
MNRVLAVSCALLSAVALAQEIGTELPPEPPPPPPETYYQPPPARAEAPAEIPGPRQGAFGLTFGLVGAGLPTGLTSSTGTGPAVPSFGLKYLATDSLALLFDVGLGVAFGNNTAVGFQAGFGVQAYLGDASRPIRPFFTGGADFGKTFDPGFDAFRIDVQVGGGAEYWFDRHFSVSGQLLLGVPLNLDDSDFVFNVVTFVPGVAANFYF